MFRCEKCGKEINLDPTVETENDGNECPQCGGIFCNECAGWTVSDDEDVCSECAEKNRLEDSVFGTEDRIEEKRKFEKWDFVDGSIVELIEKLNPSPTVIGFATDGVAEARAEIRETLVRLYCERLKLCTEEEFYP